MSSFAVAEIQRFNVHLPSAECNFFSGGAMSLDYQTRREGGLDWHNVAAVSMMGGGLVCNGVFGLWAVNAPQPMLWLPLIASFVLTIVGCGWWLLNRRGMS